MKHARGDAAFRWTVTLSGVAVLGVLALMIISTTLDALPVLRSQGLGTLLSPLMGPQK